MRYSPVFVARRAATRLFSHFVRNPLIVLLVGGLAVVLIAGQSSGLLSRAAPVASPTDDAAEQYMRGLRDQDATELLGSLSPAMQRTLEQRFGRLGPAAVASLFSEQERNGERIAGYRQVGRYETVQGESLRFYVVQAQRGNERRDVPYTLTIDSDGKVSQIE